LLGQPVERLVTVQEKVNGARHMPS
jgi:hypothetical protein